MTTLPTWHDAVVAGVLVIEDDDRIRLSLVLALEDALTMHPEQLVLDLASCPFIDATAIGMLLDIHRRVWTSGGRLTLRAPSPRVRRTLQIAHVNHVLRMVPEGD